MPNSAAKTRVQHIYWFAYYGLDSPSVRYRGKYPLEFLEKNYGVSYDFTIPGYTPFALAKFLVVYCSALLFRKKDSAIVIQRVSSNFIYANFLKLLIRLRNPNTFYDLDDADYLEHSPQTIYYFVKHCSGVFAGSHELQKNLSVLNRNISINTSPVPDLCKCKLKRNELFTIGWIGDFAGGHKESLMRDFFPALPRLDFKFKLVLVGVGRKFSSDREMLKNYFTQIPHATLEMPVIVDWSDEAAIQDLICSFDVGIATLLDNELCRSKSAFKLKQYLNNGVPVLSIDLPENNYFLEEGYNGYYCSTAGEFAFELKKLNDLTENDYKTISIQARKSADSFGLKKYCENIIGWF